MQICNDIMLQTPSKLDICAHGVERSQCKHCKRPGDADGFLRAFFGERPANPTPHGPQPRKKFEHA